MKKDTHQINIAHNLRTLISNKGVNQKDDSKKIGIRKSKFYNFLHGTMAKEVESLPKLSYFFEISLEEAIFGEVKQKVNPRGENVTFKFKK